MNRGAKKPSRNMRNPSTNSKLNAKQAPGTSQHSPAVMAGPPVDGIYSNPAFIHAFMTIVGREVEVTVRNGAVYHGVLHTVSSDSKLLLNVVHRVVSEGGIKSELPSSQDQVEDYLAFNPEDIVQIVAKNVEIPTVSNGVTSPQITGNVKGSGTPSYLTDKEISSIVNSTPQNASSMERELTPWNPVLDDANDIGSLDDHTTGTNGWTPEDMLRTNAEHCGVKHMGYDESKYTLELDKDSEDYREKIDWANEMAAKIESSNDHLTRSNLEVNQADDDEEKLFSAVDRSDYGSSPIENGTSVDNYSQNRNDFTPVSSRRTGGRLAKQPGGGYYQQRHTGPSTGFQPFTQPRHPGPRPTGQMFSGPSNTPSPSGHPTQIQQPNSAPVKKQFISAAARGSSNQVPQPMQPVTVTPPTGGNVNQTAGKHTDIVPNKTALPSSVNAPASQTTQEHIRNNQRNKISEFKNFASHFTLKDESSSSSSKPSKPEPQTDPEKSPKVVPKQQYNNNTSKPPFPPTSGDQANSSKPTNAWAKPPTITNQSNSPENRSDTLSPKSPINQNLPSTQLSQTNHNPRSSPKSSQSSNDKPETSNEKTPPSGNTNNAVNASSNKSVQQQKSPWKTHKHAQSHKIEETNTSNNEPVPSLDRTLSAPVTVPKTINTQSPAKSEEKSRTPPANEETPKEPEVSEDIVAKSNLKVTAAVFTPGGVFSPPAEEPVQQWAPESATHIQPLNPGSGMDDLTQPGVHNAHLMQPGMPNNPYMAAGPGAGAHGQPGAAGFGGLDPLSLASMAAQHGGQHPAAFIPAAGVPFMPHAIQRHLPVPQPNGGPGGANAAAAAAMMNMNMMNAMYQQQQPHQPMPGQHVGQPGHFNPANTAQQQAQQQGQFPPVSQPYNSSPRNNQGYGGHNASGGPGHPQGRKGHRNSSQGQQQGHPNQPNGPNPGLLQQQPQLMSNVDLATLNAMNLNPALMAVALQHQNMANPGGQPQFMQPGPGNPNQPGGMPGHPGMHHPGLYQPAGPMHPPPGVAVQGVHPQHLGGPQPVPPQDGVPPGGLHGHMQHMMRMPRMKQPVPGVMPQAGLPPHLQESMHQQAAYMAMSGQAPNMAQHPANFQHMNQVPVSQAGYPQFGGHYNFQLQQHQTFVVTKKSAKM